MTKSGLKPVFHKYSFICGIMGLYHIWLMSNLFEIHIDESVLYGIMI